jgi:hypothetical protein
MNSWRSKPAMCQGAAVPVRVLAEVSFRLFVNI